MSGVALLALYVVLDVALCWAMGHLVATEDVVGGTRQRLENWAYRRPDAVRYGDPSDPTNDPTDLLWDRAELWAPTRQPPPGGNRWTYRGQQGFAPEGDGRKVPTRLLSPGQLRYAVPLLDGRPLGFVDRLATIARAKVADLLGCPKCAGMWGGAIAAAVLFRYGRWPFPWPLAGVLHLAAWGLARRIGWSKD